ncbi:MAG TPA: acyl-CoA dehydrogenase family protein, partial [Terriglobales bacterium]|nr:acyl-CoA dehydrogenase family protein [Terriglobales bacterium]
MDLRLSEEEKLIRDTAAQFVARELLAREGAYLKQQGAFLPPGDPPRRDLDAATRRGLVKQAQQVGLWALEPPEFVGGSNMGALARVLIHREFGRTILPFEPACVPALMANDNHLADLVSDKLSLTLAFDQVHRTGTLSEIAIRFRPEPDGFAISMASIDVLNPAADLFLLPAREQGTNRVGLFLLDRETPGLAFSEAADLTTDATIGRITLNGCMVKGDALLGYEYEAGEIIASEQLRMAARALGMGMRCLAASIEHARNRITFGRPLSQRQAIQWMLADLSIDLRSCTWLVIEAAWRADRKMPYFDAAALAKKRAARMAFEAADAAIQIHGGYGVCKEFPFEGFYREARMMRLLYGREGE